MTIGQRIRNRRIELGFSVEELADRLGKNKATVYRYESDAIKDLPVSVLESLADALQTTPADLMGIGSEGSEQNSDSYYIDQEARKLAEFLYENPSYKILFDAAKKVRPEDLTFVQQFIDKMTK